MLQQTETAAVMGVVEVQAMQVAQAQMAADTRAIVTHANIVGVQN